MTIETDKYQNICDQLDELSDQPESNRFRQLLVMLQKYAEAGSIDAAEFLAELLAYDGRNHNAAAAYKC